jgi:hypothetical protein
MRRTALAVVAIATMAAALDCAANDAGAAEATVCPAEGAAWLRVAFEGDGFVPSLRALVVAQLGADLRGHGLALCEAPGAAKTPAPLVEIGLALTSDAVLSLDLRDAVTDKRMTREVPLRSVPADARALSITLATEELLHASWIEAAFAPSPSSASPVGLRPVPPSVREVNASEIARMPDVAAPVSGEAVAGPASPRFFQLALLGAVGHDTGGQTGLGPDLRLAWGSRFALEARAGFRVAPDVSSPHGTVHGQEILGGLGIAYAIGVRDRAVGATVGARADAVDVRFSATASSGARASSGSALGVTLDAVLGAWARLGGAWRLVAEVSLGAPVRPVTASDAGDTATGVSGLAIGGALGVAAGFPE